MPAHLASGPGLGLRLFHSSRALLRQSTTRSARDAMVRGGRTTAPRDGRAVAKRHSSSSSSSSVPSSAGSAAAAAPQSFLQRSWNSPIGVRTVHFWAPVMKWVLVLAGIGDMARPADRLSLTQNAALTATGFIWTRWCFVIRPKNILLATVNFFVGCVGAIQVSRIFAHRAAQGRKEQEEAQQAREESGSGSGGGNGSGGQPAPSSTA